MSGTVIVCAIVIVAVVLYAHRKHLSVSQAIKTKLERIESKFDGGAIPASGRVTVPAPEQK